MVNAENDILNKMPFWTGKAKVLIVIVFVFMLLFVGASALVFFYDGEEKQFLSGSIFVNGDLASAGFDVKLVFPSKDVYDENGTDDHGNFSIEVSEYMGESAYVMIFVDGVSHIGHDEQGNVLTITITEELISNKLNVYVNSNPGNIDGSSDNDDEDENNGTDHQDDHTDDDEHSPDENNSDDVGNDTVVPDETDPIDPDDDSDDPDTSPDDDDVDEDENDTEEPVIDSILYVNFTVWDNELGTWVKSVQVDKGDQVQCNVSILYNSSYNGNDVQLNGYISPGLIISDSIDVEGSDGSVQVDVINNSISWFTSTLVHDSEVFLVFNITVESVDDHVNKMNVTMKEFDETIISSEDSVSIQVYGELFVDMKIWDDVENEWVDDLQITGFDPLWCNVTVWYNGSFNVNNALIMNVLPENVYYYGNATMNGADSEPLIDSFNNTLTWEVFFDQNMKCTLLYEIFLSENNSYNSVVHVVGNESIGKQFQEVDNVSFVRIGLQSMSCQKMVRSTGLDWKQTIDAYVGEKIMYNITLKNNENSSVYNLYIVDFLPESLDYVEGSTLIIYRNGTYYREPYQSNEDDFLLWSNLNEVIEGYVGPNEQMSILFNATIIKEGLLINRVNVTSSSCVNCNPIQVTAEACVNASVPILPLAVDAGGIYKVNVDQQIMLSARVTGGTPPYVIEWDLDNDGVFDDGNNSLISMVWGKIGNYTVRVQVTDQSDEIVIDSALVNVTIPLLMVDAGGPYEAEIGEMITFNGLATGGRGNYSWFWNFSDGNFSTVQQPLHGFSRSGSYVVEVMVTDKKNTSRKDTAQVTVLEVDTAPPVIMLHDPIDAMYINDRAVFPFFVPLVFGDINISFTADDVISSVDYIELFINDKLIERFHSNMGNWSWSEQVFGRQHIHINAYDTRGNVQSMKQVVWKFF